MGSLIKYLRTKYYEFKYRKCPDGVCCCGATMHPTHCGGGFYNCRGLKEYMITSAVESKYDGRM